MANLAVNSGSTSLKVLISTNERTMSAKWEKAFSQITFKENGKKNILKVSKNFESPTAFVRIIDYFKDVGIIDSLLDINKIGYRIVHGGDIFTKPTKVNGEVLAQLKEIDTLSVNHNPIARQTVETGVKLLPKATHILCFDTTFHMTIPMYANMYGISMNYYNSGIHKYGFHGISVEYVANKVANILKKDFSDFSGIICHLGGGCSITAIEDGKSIDSTMGYTPVDGLVMAQRSGSVDPSIVKAIMEFESCNIDKAIDILSTKSGFQGIAGISDYQILRNNASNDNNCKIALQLFKYQIQKYIGSFMAILKNIDAIVFTGGIGENDTELIYDILDTEPFKRMGIFIERNTHSKRLTKENSLIPVLQIPTNEEVAILETLKQF